MPDLSATPTKSRSSRARARPTGCCRASPVVRSGLKVGRLPLLIGGMLALLAGVTGGLLRAGLQVPVLRARIAPDILLPGRVWRWLRRPATVSVR